MRGIGEAKKKQQHKGHDPKGVGQCKQTSKRMTMKKSIQLSSGILFVDHEGLISFHPTWD